MSLTYVGKLLNKVVRIPNGRKKGGIYQFLTANAFHMLLGLPFIVFLPKYDTNTRKSQESIPRNSSDYKKNSKKIPSTPYAQSISLNFDI